MITSFLMTKYLIGSGQVRVSVDPIRVALLSTNFFFTGQESMFSDVSLYEVTGTMASGGIETITTVSFEDEKLNVYLNKSGVMYWRDITATLKGAVCFANITTGAYVKPLLWWIQFDNPVALIRSDFELQLMQPVMRW